MGLVYTEYGSYIVMSSRDRRATRDIFLHLYPVLKM